MRQNDNSILNKLVKSPNFRPFAKYLAIFGAACTLLGLVMKQNGTETGPALLIAGMGSLSVLVFLLAFVERKSPIGNFAWKLLCWGGAVLLIGLLFRLMHWPESETMLPLGIGTTLVGGVLYLFNRQKENDNKDNNSKFQNQ